MRDIKFRVYDKTYKVMLYNVEKTYDYGCRGDNKVQEYSFADVLNNEQYDVMQYTGLKDKNGKEIYEGDIVRVENIDLAQIIYDEDRMAWGIEAIDEFYFDSPFLADNISLELEVIR